jgi:ankyrin repeat protein
MGQSVSTFADAARDAALREAAEVGDATAAKLLTAGATVDAAGPLRCTALHYAAKQGHSPVVQVLLSAKAAMDAVDADG